MSDCHCGLNKPFIECCGPYLNKEKVADTAEILLRARYSAFVEGDIQFIEDSHSPLTKDQFTREDTKSWAEMSTWKGLTIQKTQIMSDSETQIEFEVRYEMEEENKIHHELSVFKKQDGLWYFHSGKGVPRTIVRDEPKVGRNEPCPCGSNKKYKKCHGKP